ncbi:Hsp20/alpha crystallin family protein [bacterium]|nr:Hsp20/alpha crystallin family protein [bacterium]
MDQKVKFAEFDALEKELYHLYSQFTRMKYSSIISPVNVWHPPVDVYETKVQLVIRMEVAGLKKDDFTISLSGKYLTIQGNRGEQVTKEYPTYHNMEINFGPFERNIKLPERFTNTPIKANYAEGFLEIIIKSKESTEKSSKRIKVE